MTKQLTPQQWGMMLGQRVIVCQKNEIVGKLVRVTKLTRGYGVFIKIKNELKEYNINPDYHTCKPILRTLDQMTEEEKDEFLSLFYINLKFIDRTSLAIYPTELIRNGHTYTHHSIKAIDWLTQYGFDLRGWTNEGLALKYNPEMRGEWE